MTLKSKYSLKKINGGYYGVINVSGNTDNNNYVYAPFIYKDHTDESLREYQEFMDTYNKEHKYCPKCGSERYMTSLISYAINWDDKDSYKNLNICSCVECGNKHMAHDRVPTNKIE